MTPTVPVGPALQKAIYLALSAAGVANGNVVDGPGDAGTSYPFVEIGAEEIIPQPTSCSCDYECFTTIHIWSQPASGSKAELATIMGEVTINNNAGVEVQQQSNVRPDGGVDIDLQIDRIVAQKLMERGSEVDRALQVVRGR